MSCKEEFSSIDFKQVNLQLLKIQVFRLHQLAFISDTFKDLEKMRTDLTLKQKCLGHQTDTLEEVQKSIPVAQCSN